MENLEFEIEVTSVPEALERVKEIRASFGEVFIQVKFTSPSKNGIFKQLDYVCTALAKKVEEAK